MIEFYSPEIIGHLDVFVTTSSDEFEGKTETWNEVLIHGDPNGLRSLAKLLLELADLDQEINSKLPIGAREHFHPSSGFQLSNSSVQTIIGRLDAKGTGAFYDRYIPKESK